MATAADYEVFRARLRELRTAHGLSYERLAKAAYVSKSYLYKVAMGFKAPTVGLASRLDDALDSGGALAVLMARSPFDDEIVELAQRLRRSDLSPGMLVTLEEKSFRLRENYEHLLDARMLRKRQQCVVEQRASR